MIRKKRRSVPMRPDQINLVDQYVKMIKSAYGNTLEFYRCFQKDLKRRKISYDTLRRFLNKRYGWKIYVNNFLIDKLINISQKEQGEVVRINNWFNVYEKGELLNLIKKKGGYDKVAAELNIPKIELQKLCRPTGRKSKNDLYRVVLKYVRNGETVYISC